METIIEDSNTKGYMWTPRPGKQDTDSFVEKLKRLEAFKYLYKEDEIRNGKSGFRLNDPHMTFTRHKENPEDTDEDSLYMAGAESEREDLKILLPPKKLILNPQIYNKLSYKDNFQYCLCNLQKSERPSRNIVIRNINPNYLEFLMDRLKKFGDMQNIDLCNLERSGIIIVSFYDIEHSISCYSHLSVSLEKAMNNEQKISVEYIIPFNDVTFTDFLVLLNKEYFNEEIAVYFFSQFGKVLNVYESNDKYVVKFSDIRTLDHIQKFITHAEEKIKSLDKHQIFFIHNIILLNKENITMVYLKYAHNNIAKPESKPRKTLTIKSQSFNTPCTEPSGDVNLKNEMFNTISNLIMDVQKSTPKPEEENCDIDLNRILKGIDNRTTIMVRNIPNRYTQYNLVDIININYRGLYDFVYMPIDPQNKCNIGYAFINFIDGKHIINFYNEFFNKRWELYRSEKVCHLNYGRIQGKYNLIQHFKFYNLKNHTHKPLVLPNPLLDIPI